ncbi:MAG TPA: hypothetical protein VK627_11655 [Edaphobacter sp.]|nr:hypothetical protein [Edaphobacter sp.]
MSKLNASDIQGFALRGYGMPLARYVFLQLGEPERARTLIGKLLPTVTTGQRWDQGKPRSTLNIAFSFRGLMQLDLPLATLVSFPVEFQEGMKARGGILGDTGANGSRHWNSVWHDGDKVHLWICIHALVPMEIESRYAELERLLEETGGATILQYQDAGSLVIDGMPTNKEHFGYTDGFGNPDYLGIERKSQPGQGKLMKDGSWAPLATGELLLGYADEAGELPVAPVPHLLAANGTFMVYRKLQQNVVAFREHLERWSAVYPGGKEKLASKFMGRWRDGTPVELSADRPDWSIVQDPERSTNFTYGDDLDGTKCPIGGHIRRANPRDTFGFNGALVNRRRITRRGLTYGSYVAEDQPVSDEERGIIFIVLNACISRQFEFIQQQWMEYGNDAHLGNDKDLITGNHGGAGKSVIQGDTTRENPPLICDKLTNFVELKGGDYFFLPSITALGMIAFGIVDPR